MNKNDVNLFYDQYVVGENPDKNNFLGHFDFLSWENLQKDLSACERLQRKPFYKIALISGKSTYYSNDKEIAISGNTIVIIAPMARSGFKTSDPSFVGKYCVCSESFLRGTRGLSLMNWPVFRDRNIYTTSLTDKQYEELTGIFTEIENEYKSDYPFKEQSIQNKVFEIIHYIQKLNKNLLDFIPVQEESLEGRFFKTLEDAFLNISLTNPLVDKSPAYFAQKLNTSVDQLNKIINTVTNKTTQALIHERIIEEANILLKHTVYSVKEIAWCLHFQEPSHFQNFYKKHTNCTPQEYRTA
jgi:AraC family transcriptional activator of pobA